MLLRRTCAPWGIGLLTRQWQWWVVVVSEQNWRNVTLSQHFACFHPADFEMLEFCFDVFFYEDCALPMGCSNSCSAFEPFSTFPDWVLKDKSGLALIVHYLDYFLLAGPGGTRQCAFLMEGFLALSGELGVSLVEDKMEGPAQCLMVLGIELDMVAMTSRLREAKLIDLRDRLCLFSSWKKVQLRELQVLLGHLNFACKMVAPGPAFLCWICAAMKGVSCPYHWIRLSLGMRQDLKVWLDFLDNFNRMAFWWDELCLEAELQFELEAAGPRGLFSGTLVCRIMAVTLGRTGLDSGSYIFGVLPYPGGCLDLGRGDG